MTKLSEIIASFVRKDNTQPLERNVFEVHQTEAEPERRTDTPAGPAQTENPVPGIEITEEFRHGFDLVASRTPFLFITGRAGTGKSTFTNLLKERLHSFAVVAPTGVAAFNVGGQTIHSFFRFAPGPIDLSKITTVRNKIAYKALRHLIIDEISMVRADLLDAMDKFLRENGPDSLRPFGGVQIIAVGDLFQLPPIIETREEQAFLSQGYKSPYFFSAKCLADVQMITVEFSKVFRQTEESFVSILNLIREGKQLEDTLSQLNERVREISEHEEECIILTATNAAASRINAKRLSDIDGPIGSYRGEIIGEIKLDQNKLPAPIDLELKVGAQVMFVKNDRKKRWVNGTVGTVVECGKDYVNVCFPDNYGKHEVRVEKESWDNNKYEYDADVGEVRATKIGSYQQLPLTLAWAITIHKSQGKTFDRIHVDLGRGAFAEGQVYVALSRCRTLEGVTLGKAIEKKDIQLNWDVIEFVRGAAVAMNSE